MGNCCGWLFRSSLILFLSPCRGIRSWLKPGTFESIVSCGAFPPRRFFVGVSSLPCNGRGAPPKVGSQGQLRGLWLRRLLALPASSNGTWSSLSQSTSTGQWKGSAFRNTDEFAGSLITVQVITPLNFLALQSIAPTNRILRFGRIMYHHWVENSGSLLMHARTPGT